MADADDQSRVNRAIALESIQLILSTAPRNEADCMVVSGLLVDQMLATINAYIDKGHEYLLEGKK